MLAVIKTGEALAWTDFWKEEMIRTHRIVVVPELRLTQPAALQIISRMSYAEVFKNAELCSGHSRSGPFILIHSDFSLFKTGESAIDGFAALVPGDEGLPQLSETIKRASKLLELANDERRVQKVDQQDYGRSLRGRLLR